MKNDISIVARSNSPVNQDLKISLSRSDGTEMVLLTIDFPISAFSPRCR